MAYLTEKAVHTQVAKYRWQETRIILAVSVFFPIRVDTKRYLGLYLLVVAVPK